MIDNQKNMVDLVISHLDKVEGKHLKRHPKNYNEYVRWDNYTQGLYTVFDTLYDKLYSCFFFSHLGAKHIKYQL